LCAESSKYERQLREALGLDDDSLYRENMLTDYPDGGSVRAVVLLPRFLPG